MTSEINQLQISCLRIGQGVDIHAFASGRKLFLGGVEVTHHCGLSGHSDADVLLHAIIDAVLGALAWGDIGQWFPDSEERFKGACSKDLFSYVWNKAKAEGWGLGNCDCVILAQEPKISPYSTKIKESVAGLFFADSEKVNIKGKTTEHLGFLGRREGIAAFASVLLIKGF